MDSPINASDLLLAAVKRHNIHLSILVAETGLWAHPDFHTSLLEKTGSAALFPNVRRVRVAQGETRGQVVNGVRLDDNTYANVTIKRALGLGKSAIGFEACHIWPLSCYDERYHTAVANLVLLPRALAGLSDHDSEIQRALQYRALELYDWWPSEMPTPIKPNYYPDNWLLPRPLSILSQTKSSSTKSRIHNESHEMKMNIHARLQKWALKPNLKVHKMIAIVAQARSGISRSDLVKRVEEVTKSKNSYGAVASLLSDEGNSYGLVLVDQDGIIRFHPSVEQTIQAYTWRIDAS